MDYGHCSWLPRLCAELGYLKFYSCTIESILTGCITTWYGNCSASDHKVLQRVVRTAQYIIGAKISAIQDLYNRHCQRKAHKIVKDSSHPSHRLVFSAIARQAVPERKFFLNSFYPQAIRLLNNLSNGHRTITLTLPPFVFTLLLLVVYYLRVVNYAGLSDMTCYSIKSFLCN